MGLASTVIFLDMGGRCLGLDQLGVWLLSFIYISFIQLAARGG